jgi:hypothetical protein
MPRPWSLVEGDSSSSATPAGAREPGSRWHDRVRRVRRRSGSTPSAEPRPRAARIDPWRRPQVLPKVEEYIDETPARLGRRAEGSPVIAARPDAATPTARAIDRLRASDRQPLKPAHERLVTVAFDEKMDVVRLHGELHDPKGRFVRIRERALDGGEDARRAQRWNLAPRAPGDVHRPPRAVSGARSMRRRGPRRDELSSRALPPSSPMLPVGQLQPKLPGPLRRLPLLHAGSSARPPIGCVALRRSLLNQERGTPPARRVPCARSVFLIGQRSPAEAGPAQTDRRTATRRSQGTICPTRGPRRHDGARLSRSR